MLAREPEEQNAFDGDEGDKHAHAVENIEDDIVQRFEADVEPLKQALVYRGRRDGRDIASPCHRHYCDTVQTFQHHHLRYA